MLQFIHGSLLSQHVDVDKCNDLYIVFQPYPAIILANECFGQPQMFIGGSTLRTAASLADAFLVARRLVCAPAQIAALQKEHEHHGGRLLLEVAPTTLNMGGDAGW